MPEEPSILTLSNELIRARINYSLKAYYEQIENGGPITPDAQKIDGVWYRPLQGENTLQWFLDTLRHG